MIVDTINHVEQLRGISPLFSQAVDWLQNTDFCTLPLGTTEIDGKRLYVSVQGRDTKPADEGLWEAHRKYADIQVVFEGRELMGYCSVAKLIPSELYCDDTDVEFYSGGSQSLCLIEEGMFALFLPQDAHMPNISAGDGVERGKKLVVKVLV